MKNPVNSIAAPRYSFRNDAPSALGRITAAAYIPTSFGMPAGKYRVFGQYAVVYLMAGGGLFRDIRGFRTRVGPGDLMLVFPEIGHNYGPPRGNDWTEWFVTFEGPVFDLWRSSGLLNPERPVIHLDAVQEWGERFEKFVSARRAVTPAERALELTEFLQMLTEILAAGAPENVESSGSGWLAEACRLMEQNLDRPVDWDFVTQEIGLSYDTFRKLFARYTGTSPARYRAARLIDAACAMMQHDNLTNAEIARRLGFTDEFHFSKRFKQIAGMTPRDFRRTLLRHDLPESSRSKTTLAENQED